MVDNPIAQRLGKLRGQWQSFADVAEARLLRWQVEDDELPMVEALFAAESKPEAAETRDLFLIVPVPFADANRHGLALRDWLCATWETERTQLAAAGVKAEWSCPALQPGHNDIQSWLEALLSFHQAVGGADNEHVAVWLRPAELGDRSAHVMWLQQLAHAAPARARFVVTDEQLRSELTTLAKYEPVRVYSQVAALDMPGALEELASGPLVPPGPGADFRLAYVRMGNAAKRGQMAEAEKQGDVALSVARAQGWHSLASVAQFGLAACALQINQPAQASQRFLAAEQSAQAGEATGEPQARLVRMQSRLLAGSAQLSAGDFDGAGMLFRTTVPLAQAVPSPRDELDAWRLTSYCHEQDKHWQPAWDAGLEGFKAAKAMDEDTRASSSAHYLCEALMRLTKHRSLSAYAQPMEGRPRRLRPVPWAAPPNWVGDDSHRLLYSGAPVITEIRSNGGHEPKPLRASIGGHVCGCPGMFIQR